MKHTIKITLFLLAMFFISQIVGLFFIANITEVSIVDEVIVVSYQDTAIGERPEVSGGSSVFYMSIIIFLGTIFFLILAKFKAKAIWKGWYFLAIVLAITVAIGVFLNSFIAFILALILSLIKLIKPNPISHNFTEILMYAGIAVIFVPLFDIFWMFIFLILISLYDMYAVWKSKHMIKMAKFASETNLFAGLSLNYNVDKKIKSKSTKETKSKKVLIETKKAILGGGDVVFPLIFSGVVMQYLVENGFSLINSYYLSLIVVVFSSISLYLLFYYSKKDKFYPAMPFLSTGCFLGFGIVYLITLIL